MAMMIRNFGRDRNRSQSPRLGIFGVFTKSNEEATHSNHVIESSMRGIISISPSGLIFSMPPREGVFSRPSRRLGWRLLFTFFMLFHYGLDELSEFSVFSAFFNVGKLIVFRFFHQLQITLVSIRAQYAVINCVEECAAGFLSMGAICKTAVF